MFEKERELVELGPHSYNLKEGGEGGFESHLQLEYRRLADLALEIKYGKEWRKLVASLGAMKTNVVNRQRGTGLFDPSIRQLGIPASLTNKSKEKRRQSYKKIQHQQGEKNSQFETMWITNDQMNRKIKKTAQIPDGWRKGRVNKPNATVVQLVGDSSLRS